MINVAICHILPCDDNYSRHWVFMKVVSKILKAKCFI